MSLGKGSDVDEKDVAVVVRPVDDLKKLGYEQELARVSEQQNSGRARSTYLNASQEVFRTSCSVRMSGTTMMDESLTPPCSDPR